MFPSQFAQELLSTFNNALGEVALQPSTGGTFIVSMYYSSEFAAGGEDPVQIQHHVLWDRKAEGGFPGRSLVFHLSFRPLACVAEKPIVWAASVRVVMFLS